ncbi:AraC family transcriptional regulator [Paraburkholderia sp. MMS20-SJTN17]|uniref:AraC family transcriptional regulator n=1 Tax=Paraburkholderia translucens TaxID=2886945 RepID=A0ABS8KDH6_9BURK|nr:AraC family transcriptional regulator [Paraburkholderia sp. MMS20-SJTN17]MCC8402494.1 AraC family transcriptional regulator [Paraburkholderia sp. MMS20-SJTN17]
MQSDLSYGRNFVELFKADSVSQLTTKGPKTSRLLVSRLRRDTPGHGLVTPPQCDAVFSVMLQLREQKQRELFLDGRCIHRGAYLARTTSVVNHLELPCANLISPFDKLMFTVPQTALNEIADESGVARVDHLYCQPGGVLDETIWHLANSLLPALERPHEVSSMYAEHVMLGAYTYFAQRFGGMHMRKGRPGMLAPWQLRRAREAMSSQIDADVSLKALATESGLSVSYFVRAFKASTGDPPHRWMLRHRIERSKALLRRTEASLAEVAASCGFADQSHFARVFKSFVGVSPAAWKRSIRS